MADLTANDAPIRLSKRLSELGICSRREADRYIAAGQVLVDGQRVAQLGTKVTRDQDVALAPEAAATQAERVTVLLHKPVGYVSGQAEDGHPPAWTLLTPENRQRGSWTPFPGDALPDGWDLGLAPAGRLDIDSRGLLVLTQDGVVARTLVGPQRRVDKAYRVRVDRPVDDRALGLLRHGLSLDGRQLLPARIERKAPDLLLMTLREGRKRQIRRMCAEVGLDVRSLFRERIGGVQLGALPPGQWRFLRPDERFDRKLGRGRRRP